MSQESKFKSVFSDITWSDKFYQFLQVVYHLYPEDKFHYLISQTCKEKQTDEEIYKTIQQKLSTIKPFLSELTYALPALKKQKKEMTKQVLYLLKDNITINGYLEIGSTGRYISDLKNQLSLSGNIYLTNYTAPDFSIPEIMERGQISKIGTFFPINNYQAIQPNQIPDNSIDLITCHIGLHHCTHELLDGYIKSLHRILRKGGKFIIRDHDMKTPEMATFVTLVHTVFNLGLKVSWEIDRQDFISLKSIEEWSQLFSQYGFKDDGVRLLQEKDPSENTLVLFTKQ